MPLLPLLAAGEEEKDVEEEGETGGGGGGGGAAADLALLLMCVWMMEAGVMREGEAGGQRETFCEATAERVVSTYLEEGGAVTAAWHNVADDESAPKALSVRRRTPVRMFTACLGGCCLAHGTKCPLVPEALLWWLRGRRGSTTTRVGDYEL